MTTCFPEKLMPDFNSQSWSVLSPYLDQALEMNEQERIAWLASLRERQPDLAADVQALLDEHGALVREHFLENPIPVITENCIRLSDSLVTVDENRSKLASCSRRFWT